MHKICRDDMQTFWKEYHSKWNEKKYIPSFEVCSYLAYNELCVDSAMYVVFFYG